MVTGRTALAGCATVVAIGCAGPAAERPPSAEPERTYVGQHDDRPLPSVAQAKAAPAANCPVASGNAGGSELALLSLFSTTLSQVRDYYPRDITPRSRELLLASLWAVEATDRDVLVERDLDAPPRWVSVTVKGERCTLNIERVDAPATLLSSLQDGMRFIGSRLALPTSETDARFTKIELAATNGMLAALDRQSRLVDADTYRDIRAQPPGASAATDVAPARQAAEPIGLTMAALSTRYEVAYLRPDGFRRGSAAQVEQGTLGSGGTAPKGVVLDLRNNPGGLLDEATRVADVFIERGVLGWIVDRDHRKALEAHDSGHDFEGSVVVLVNHQTSAAAELVASAIKSQGRGVIFGEETAGAGSIRDFFDLPVTSQDAPPAPAPPGDAAPPEAAQPQEVLGLLLRTGYLWTANDAPIEGAGVRPDLQQPSPSGATSAANDDCLLQLAQAVISQAPDARRSTLLSTATALANKQVCAHAR